MKVFLRSPGFISYSFSWKVFKPRWGGPISPPPLGQGSVWELLREDILLGNREGSGGALLLALDAGDAALLDEEAESCAHLLSGDTELRSHLLVGDGGVLLSESVEHVLTEVDNLLVHLRLARTSSRTSELIDLLLAELNDLRIVGHCGSDASVEVLLGGLDLGHDFLLSGTRVPVLGTSPFDSFFFEEVVLFFYIYYTIFLFILSSTFFLDLPYFLFHGPFIFNPFLPFL